MPITRRLALAGLGLVATPAVLRAQGAWPNKPVKILIGFAPGGSIDAIGRTIGQHMEKAFGQPFVVENRSGAGGRIATAAVGRSPGDGYTLMVTSSAAHGAAPGLYADLGYDALRDFTHIGLICSGPMVFMAQKNAPYRNLRQFVDHVKARGTPVSYGSGGIGSLGHLTGALIGQTLGVRMEHISYRGSAPALADMMAGQLETISDNLSSAAGQYRSGDIQVLAAASRERFPGFPDMPTFTEQGYPQLVANAWYGFSGSAGIPADITAKLNHELRVLLEQPPVREQLLGMAMQPEGRMSSAEYTAFVASEVTRWTAVTRSAGIKAE